MFYNRGCKIKIESRGHLEVIMAMDKLFHQPSQRVLDTLNESFKDYQPGQLILATAGISLATAYIYGQLTHKVTTVFP